MASLTPHRRDRPTRPLRPMRRGASKRVTKEIHRGLLAKRAHLLHQAQESLEAERDVDKQHPPEILDLATREGLQSFELRLRSRERLLLRKIEQALSRIEEGTFGICDECDEPIGEARLRARPEATLCIECKTAAERIERNYRDR